MINFIFSINCLVFLGMILLFYFSKNRVNNIENKIYSGLLTTNVIGLIIDIFGYFTMNYLSSDALINIIISHLYLIYYFTWGYLLMIYVYSISYQQEESDLRHKYLFISIAVVISLLLTLFPIEVHMSENAAYSSGIGVNLVYITSALSLLIDLFWIIRNFKKVVLKKYAPILVLLLVSFVSMAVQQQNPEINLLIASHSLVTFIMFFTIENPDYNLITALDVAKKQADKANQAKTEFLSSMSHEIRTPLNAIVGFSNSIIEEENLKEIKEEAKDIVMASQNLLEIVNGILNISKIEAGKMEIINTNYNLTSTIDDIVKLVKPRIEEKPIELKVKYAKDIPGVLYGDQGKVKEIITNILTNACKYTEKGTISVDVSCINEKDISKLVIGIEDTGRGIKPEKIDKLFTKFDRLDEDKNTTLEGTGLGLAITKSLVDMMGGKIIVQSKYGSGSKFTVYLSQKIVSMDNNLEIEKDNKLDLIDYSNKKILVVDDNKLNLKVATRLLKNYNITPDTCESGLECLDKIKSNTYDLILMDDMMPKMSGVETMNKLKEDKKFKTPIIILTANAVSGMKEQYLSEGASDYLAKPIDKYELDRILNKFLK